VRVTLNLFSGRPNPSWRLTPSQARHLVERVAAPGVPVEAEEAPALGLRGITVDAEMEDVVLARPVPSRFVLATPAVAAARRPAKPAGRRSTRGPAADVPTPPDAHGLVEWLLTTAGDALESRVAEEVRSALRGEPPSAAAVERDARGRGTSAEAELTSALDASGCEPFLTAIHAGFWNTPSIRFRNNCYNYATNFVSNTLAQPGRRAGRQFASFDCQSVANAAASDGCLPSCRGSVRVVALAIWPGFDFHWWRLHPNASWAHKIGTSPVLQVDNAGRRLTNALTPANCDRGPYTRFCGFFFVPLGVTVL
jgi:hypothetical protein